MACASWKLNPPSRETYLGSLSPEAFLACPEVRGLLDGLDELYESIPNMEQPNLVPQPEAEDKTMVNYHERTSALPARREHVQVEVPLQGMFKTYLIQHKELKGENKELKEEQKELKEDLKLLKDYFLEADEKQVDVYAANLLMKMVDLISPKNTQEPKSSKKERKGNGSGRSERYRNAHKNISKDVFSKDHNLPLKYHDALRHLPQLINTRNEAAHETQREFARLLVRGKGRNPDRYAFWGPLFTFCYGKSVEVLAREELTTRAWDQEP